MSTLAHGYFPADPPLAPDEMRLLVVGGTFDPPHRAHLSMACAAARATGSNRVIFVPARRSPHKMDADNQPTSAEHRLAMIRIAVAGAENAPGAAEGRSSTVATLSVSPFEALRPPPSYTVDTLAALRASVGASATIRLLIGADQALAFDRWHKTDRILQLATPAVVLRPPWNNWDALRDAAGGRLDDRWADWLISGIDLDFVSSTALRARIAAEVWGDGHRGPNRGGDDPQRAGAEEPLARLVPPAVLAYIRQHGLYRPSA